jgi:hypothetical protein
MNTDLIRVLSAGSGVRWKPTAVVSKYDDDQVAYVSRLAGPNPDGASLSRYCTPYETIESEGNLLTTAGVTRITGLIIGTLSTTLDSTRVRLGVGDSATAATVADTDLGTNKYYRVMDATYPQAAAGVLTFTSSFGSSDGNYAWQCWGLDVGTATVTSSATVATLVNRKVSSLGTKSSGTWVLTVTVTFA